MSVIPELYPAGWNTQLYVRSLPKEVQVQVIIEPLDRSDEQKGRLSVVTNAE